MTISIITTTDLGTTLSLVNNKVTVSGIGGGHINQIPVQAGESTTSFIAAPTTAGTALTWNGSDYTWEVPSGGSAVTVDGNNNLVSTGAGASSSAYDSVALGPSATAGLSSVGIGDQAASSGVLSLALGAFTSASDDSSVVIGAGTGRGVSLNSSTAPNQVTIGNSQNTEYVLHGSLSFGGTGAGGTAGQVLTSTGNGTSPTWSTPTSGGATGPLEVDSNTIITSSAVTAAGGIAIGYLTTVSGNGVAIGTQSTATSSESTAVGSQAEATGAFSSAFGKGARSWGTSSIAIGADAYAEETGVALGAGSSARLSGIAIGSQVNAQNYQAVIGSNAITETHLFGSLHFGDVGQSGNPGQVLTSTGNGTSPTWSTPTSGGSTTVSSDTNWITNNNSQGVYYLINIGSQVVMSAFMYDTWTARNIYLSANDLAFAGPAPYYTLQVQWVSSDTSTDAFDDMATKVGLSPAHAKSASITYWIDNSNAATPVYFNAATCLTSAIPPIVIWTNGAAPSAGSNGIDRYTVTAYVSQASERYLIIDHSLAVGSGGAAGSAQDASGTQAGIVNLTDGQVLGAGSKIIGGVTIGLAGPDMHIAQVTTSASPSILIGKGAFDPATETASIGIGNGAQATGTSTAVGTNASANYNGISIGLSALTAGQDSQAIGTAAWSNGIRSTAIGTYTSATHDYSVVIGSGEGSDLFNASTANNQVTLGNASNTEYVLHGALSFGGSGNGGTAGQVLTSAGNGISPVWAASGGGATSLDGLSDVVVDSTSMLLGRSTTADTFGTGSNTSIGVSSLASITPNSQSGFGSNNTAVGCQALRETTTGYNNVAVGPNSLLFSTDGHDNTAVGAATLLRNTHGHGNVGIGANSLQNNTEGYSNIAVGYSALVSNTTGIYNIGIGHQASSSCSTGHSNVAIGENTLGSNLTGSYNIAIGELALYYTTGSGNVEIGGMASSGSRAPAYNITNENNRISMGSTAVTNAYIQVAWTVVSDERDKEIKGPVLLGLAFVKQLKPLAYRYKVSREDTEGHGPLRYGFGAGQVLAIEQASGNEPVIVDAEDPDKLRFNDQSLIAVSVNAIQELDAKLEALQKVIEQQASLIQSLLTKLQGA